MQNFNFTFIAITTLLILKNSSLQNHNISFDTKIVTPYICHIKTYDKLEMKMKNLKFQYTIKILKRKNKP